MQNLVIPWLAYIPPKASVPIHKRKGTACKGCEQESACCPLPHKMTYF